MLKKFCRLLGMLLLAAALVAVAALSVLFAVLPPVELLRDRYPLVHYRGPKQAPRVTLEKQRPPAWVSLHSVSLPAVGAILVSEDWAFYQHRGFDLQQIRESAEENWRARRFVRGASTITQQVARNVFLTRDKNLWRKAKELVLATRLEKTLKKRQILEIYLNIAEWGEGIYGISAASRHYFQKVPAELSAKEGAFLAMLLPNPQRYSISFQRGQLTRYAARTIDSILRKMVQAGYLEEEQWAAVQAAPLPFEKAAATSPEPAEEENGGFWGIF